MTQTQEKTNYAVEVPRDVASLGDKSPSLTVKDGDTLKRLVYLGLEFSTFIMWARTAVLLPTRASKKKESITVLHTFEEYVLNLLEASKHKIARIHCSVLALKANVSDMEKNNSPLLYLYKYYLHRLCVLCPGMIVVDSSLSVEELKHIVAAEKGTDVNSRKLIKNKHKKKDHEDEKKCVLDDEFEKLITATMNTSVGIVPSYIWAVPKEDMIGRFTAKIFTDIYKLTCELSVTAYLLLDTMNSLRVIKDGNIGQTLKKLFSNVLAVYKPFICNTIVRFTPESRALYLEAAVHIRQLQKIPDNRSNIEILIDLDGQVETSARRRNMHEELIKKANPDA